MPDLLQTLGGGLLLALVTGIVVLGWKDSSSYARLEKMVRGAVLASTLFAIGFVVGSNSGVTHNVITGAVLISIPTAVWLIIWSWKVVSRDLQGKKPFDYEDDGDAPKAKRQHADIDTE